MIINPPPNPFASKCLKFEVFSPILIMLSAC